MHNILDSVKPKAQGFRPQTLAEYLALQLAKRLGDPDLAWKYRSLFDEHTLTEVSEAFTKARDRVVGGGGALIQTFEQELSVLTENQDDDAP